MFRAIATLRLLAESIRSNAFELDFNLSINCVGNRMSLCTGSASPHETKFVLELIAGCWTAGQDFWVVVNHNMRDDPVDGFRSTQTKATAKLRYTFRL